VLAVLALTAGSVGAAALQPWPLKILIDHGLEREPAPGWLIDGLGSVGFDADPWTLVLVAVFGSLVFFALGSGLEATIAWIFSAAGRRMTNDLAAELFRRLQRRSLLLHQRSSVGDSLGRLTTDTWCVQEMTAGVLIAPVKHLLTLGLLGSVGWRLNPDLAVLSLILAPILGTSSWFFGRKLRRRARHAREAQSRLMSFVQQTLASIPIVQAFRREEFNQQHFRGLAGEVTRWAQGRAVIDGWYAMANGLIATSGVAIVLYFGGLRVLDGSLSIGELLVFVTYMRTLQIASEAFASTYGSLKPVQASIDRVLEILDTPDSLPERPGAASLGTPKPGSARHVLIEKVTFGYLPGHPVLRDITVEVPPGHVVAFVGKTGVGKTTLASLVPRFFDPVTGRVLIDGTDVRDVRLASVREQVSLVLQEPFILPLTIAENIAYGNSSAGRSEIEAAAKAANAHEFIERLPGGYDAVVGEGGATLSGGEQQRLSIARALLKDAPILILDEPTSALDASSEAVLLEALNRLMAGRTTLIIGHRLSTVRHADEIVVLDKGRVAERGTHDQLIRGGGLYHDLYRAQALARPSADVA
jgi:ATP-binding cassette, subfamily B, bacterial